MYKKLVSLVMTRKIILVVIIVFILVFGIYQVFLKKEEPTFSLAEVSRGMVSQEVSETGQVQKGEKINLIFKNSGSIEKIYVKVGQDVKEGDVLAKIDIADLYIQFQELLYYIFFPYILHIQYKHRAKNTFQP